MTNIWGVCDRRCRCALVPLPRAARASIEREVPHAGARGSTQKALPKHSHGSVRSRSRITLLSIYALCSSLFGRHLRGGRLHRLASALLARRLVHAPVALLAVGAAVARATAAGAQERRVGSAARGARRGGRIAGRAPCPASTAARLLEEVARAQNAPRPPPAVVRAQRGRSPAIVIGVIGAQPNSEPSRHWRCKRL